ncbi:hypothetical protein GCM10010172_37520 [Paractinoplanes ferrugineus]|uniref:LPXTG-motif cell wall-anchored protein n=1 Tax=Paractinoplanes ferrugineus TaxID=113564 RepID=A0A919MCC8_9ACTN|nr:hypothetical protein [Actinoplanes ferrugineus]GIE09349.1 hypothetical protein Afe05nite_11890 [Actinoplanes ferrugineus]
MSAYRRILAVGLPSMAIAAAMAFSAAPAVAAAHLAARPSTTATPCADDERTKCDYASVSPAHTRGHGGYASPTTTKPSPSTTPTGDVDTVPPTTPPGVLDTGTPAPGVKSGGGVSAGHALPVTGPPTGGIVSVGGVMVAAGVASVWYTRRRRTV